MNAQEQELKEILTGQPFDRVHPRTELLEKRKRMAQSYAETENGIAVLSDFQENTCYIYSGSFGRCIGLQDTAIKADSAFEEEIFRCIPPDELLERHVLELRFYQFQQTLPLSERTYYNMVCTLHFRTTDARTIPVLHRSYYWETTAHGSIWLGLCLYSPFLEAEHKLSGQIIDNRTGQAILPETYRQLDKQMLSPREKEVLALLAKGESSKQIAQTLCLSVNTIYRHRQNILSALQVNNTAAAVEIGLRLHLIP